MLHKRGDCELLLICWLRPRLKLILILWGHNKFTEHWAADHYYGHYEEIECCDESVSTKHLKLSDGEHTILEVEVYKSSLVPEDFFVLLIQMRKHMKRLWVIKVLQ